jgi:hypothetical protein
MLGRRVGVFVAAGLVALCAGCANLISGTPTWPGATLEKVALTAADLPPGVQYDRIIDDPGKPDGAGGPSPMLSKPAGCSNALTDVIAHSAERGPGAVVKYSVVYNSARVLMAVLSSPLNLDQLAATAARCERFQAFFDPASEGIPMTMTKLPGGDDGALVYQQTMELKDSQRSIYMAFQNVGKLALFGMAFPIGDPSVPVKASLPQTFLDLVAQQADRMRSA